MGRRLSAELLRVGLKAQDVANRLKISKQRVSHWRTGQSGITNQDLLRLRDEIGLDVEFILTGVRSPSKKGPAKLLIPRPEDFVPKLSPSQILVFSQEKLDLAELPKTEFAYTPHSDRSFVFDMFDASMSPTPAIHSVGIDPQKVPEAGDCTLVVLEAHNEVLFRRYQPGTSGKPSAPPFVLTADNPAWPSQERIVRAADRPVIVGGSSCTFGAGRNSRACRGQSLTI
jgi:transcriptional regulator with XRE-family HTH domain